MNWLLVISIVFIGWLFIFGERITERITERYTTSNVNGKDVISNITTADTGILAQIRGTPNRGRAFYKQPKSQVYMGYNLNIPSRQRDADSGASFQRTGTLLSDDRIFVLYRKPSTRHDRYIYGYRNANQVFKTIGERDEIFDGETLNLIEGTFTVSQSTTSWGSGSWKEVGDLYPVTDATGTYIYTLLGKNISGNDWVYAYRDSHTGSVIDIFRKPRRELETDETIILPGKESRGIFKVIMRKIKG